MVEAVLLAGVVEDLRTSVHHQLYRPAQEHVELDQVEPRLRGAGLPRKLFEPHHHVGAKVKVGQRRPRRRRNVETDEACPVVGASLGRVGAAAAVSRVRHALFRMQVDHFVGSTAFCEAVCPAGIVYKQQQGYHSHGMMIH